MTLRHLVANEIERLTKYIVRATCGSDRSSEVRVVESEFTHGTLYAFTVARHTELSKRYHHCLFLVHESADFRQRQLQEAVDY